MIDFNDPQTQAHLKLAIEKRGLKFSDFKVRGHRIEFTIHQNSTLNKLI